MHQQERRPLRAVHPLLRQSSPWSELKYRSWECFCRDMSVAKIIQTEDTRARLVQMASDYLVRAAQLEHDQKK
jgi:hypothetical protein